MAIIATVRQHDTWEGRATLELKKFIPEHLMTFEGSAGYGGEEAENPVQAAKDYAEAKGYTGEVDGHHILVIDTQSPEGTNTHAYSLFPYYRDENDFNLTWEK